MSVENQSLSVYFVSLPEGKTVGGYGYQPPEFYWPCGVFVAASRGQAKAMLLAADGDLDVPDDFLDMRVQRLGAPNGREAKPGPLSDRSRWWGRICEPRERRESSVVNP